MTETLIVGDAAFEVEAAGPLLAADGYWLAPAGDLTVTHPFGATKFYRHGWHSWALTHWADLGALPRPVASERRMFQADDLVNMEGTAHRGNWVGAIQGRDGDALVIGSLGWDSHVVGSDTQLVGRCVGKPVEWFIGYGAAEAVLERYAAVLGDRVGNVRQAPGRVWCSWYSFYEDITEADMVTALAGLAGSAFDVVQIDDGWQQEIGDWIVNHDFPSGMKATAGRIADDGYRPGLWIAPFIAHSRSQTLIEHPEWFVKDGSGDPLVAGVNWGGPYYALDMTHPGALERVTSVISAAVEWGFTYLKLDFLFAAGVTGARHDNDVAREAVYRAGVEAIRAAAGADTYLLACGGLIVPSIGVFDGIRVGQDVAPHWENRTGETNEYSAPSTRYAVSNSHSRLWLDPVIAVDPDVVYFRSQANEMTPEQMRSLQDIALICDFVATSDPPSWLEADERAAMDAYLRSDPQIVRLDRYRFQIDERTVDFREASLDE